MNFRNRFTKWCAFLSVFFFAFLVMLLNGEKASAQSANLIVNPGGESATCTMAVQDGMTVPRMAGHQR